MGIGLMIAGAQILLTHGMADGEFGLSVDDVVYSYYGNRENSRLEEKLNGTMKDKASSQERAQLIKWARSGAKESEWVSNVQPIIAKNCAHCHSAIPGLPDITQLEIAQQVAKTDKGISVHSLTRVSHVHIFGIAFIYLFLGAIFSLSTGIDPKIKAVAIGMPFLFLVIDIASWWLTKFFPSAAYLTIVAGTGYNIASVFMMLTSLYQMWVLPQKTSKDA